MARPTSIQDPIVFRRYGVVLGVHPSTNLTLPVELWSSTQSASTASTLWAKRTLPPSTAPVYNYTFERAPSTRQHHFKARHPATPGFSAGSFTPTISGRPVELPRVHPPSISLVNTQGNVEPVLRHIWVTSGQTVKVGTEQATGVKDKTIRWPASAFYPTQSTGQFRYGIGTLVVGTTGTDSTMQVNYVMPIGSKITRWRTVGRKASTAETLRLRLYRISTAGVASTVATLTFTASTGLQTQESSVLNETVGTANYFIARTTMITATVINTPSIVYSELDYEMPSYEKQY